MLLAYRKMTVFAVAMSFSVSAVGSVMAAEDAALEKRMAEERARQEVDFVRARAALERAIQRIRLAESK